MGGHQVERPLARFGWINLALLGGKPPLLGATRYTTQICCRTELRNKPCRHSRRAPDFLSDRAAAIREWVAYADQLLEIDDLRLRRCQILGIEVPIHHKNGRPLRMKGNEPLPVFDGGAFSPFKAQCRLATGTIANEER